VLESGVVRLWEVVRFSLVAMCGVPRVFVCGSCNHGCSTCDSDNNSLLCTL